MTKLFADIPADMRFDVDQGWVEWSPASTAKFVCRTNIEVDSQGLIVSYYADGDCTTYNSVPPSRK